MYAASVGKKQIGKGMIFALVGLAALVAVLLFAGKGGGEGGENAPDGSTEELRRGYLTSFGYVLSETSSIADVGVPSEFDERFLEYNAMLKTTGFDLEGYKGKTIKKCTYTVVNREDLGGEINAVLLLDGDSIIGGHLVNAKSGTLYPLFEITESEEGDAPDVTETILPAVTQEQETKETEEIPASAYPTE